MLGPTLETPRLLLRPPAAQDFEAFVACMADVRVAQHLGGVQSRELAWRSFAMFAGAWTLNGFSLFSVVEKASGRWVGRVGPWMPEGWPGPEVGWAIIADAQRRGYAKEAASAALDWAFDSLGWREVVHCIEPRNAASIATARSLGSVLVRSGVRAPQPLNVTWDVYAQTREHWRARRGLPH
ncbi:MAG: hypothetical protein RL701_1884 [Pseudomonadota bacterium]